MLSIIFTEDSFRIDHTEAALTEGEAIFKERFPKDRYEALFLLGFRPKEKGEGPGFSFLRALSTRFMKALTSLPDLEIARDRIFVELTENDYEALIRQVPFGLGTEYISRTWLSVQFMRLNQTFARAIRDFEGSVQLFLSEKSQNLRVPERIFFHLVENRKTDEAPFAFLATYSTKDAEDKVVHMPLSYALEEYKQDREHLLKLLSCLSQVSEVSPLIASFVESGEMFHPLRLDAPEAWSFLKAVPDIEKCGVVCRVPNWWRRRDASVSMQVNLGEEKPSMLGFESLVSMKPQLVFNGVPLTEAEIQELLLQTEGLSLLKGRWVEVDHAKLRLLLEQMKQYEGNLTLLEALRMESGMSKEAKEGADVGPLMTNGAWLSNLLKGLRQPASIEAEEVPENVQATLRSYQETGFKWLCYMHRLGFGACLADDMGLGKTLQVLTYLSWLYEKKPEACVLLVVPASLLGNWEKEAAKFTPH
ncbi:MAG: SNF2 helicase-associated domain-containing protein, partial [bacterium]